RLLALILASLTLIAVDREGPALDPARRAMGELIGPMAAVTEAVVRPIVALPDAFEGHQRMRREVARLTAENADLRRAAATADVDRNRLATFDGLTQTASTSGQALVPARVIGMAPEQSFSSVATIDAGADAGIRPDMTVLNNDGLVGRVLRTTPTTATVLLIVDAESTVGARLGRNMEVGVLRGRGVQGEDGRLDLELIDDGLVPARDDVVVTWGSKGGAPYVGAVPIGRVTEVFSSPSRTTRRAVIAPFVDFTALDVVAVVVPTGTVSDRAVIEADGTLR
ncbi:MAG: rod shape-determining protein MreC, partial [Nocardioides sp.]